MTQSTQWITIANFTPLQPKTQYSRHSPSPIYFVSVCEACSAHTTHWIIHCPGHLLSCTPCMLYLLSAFCTCCTLTIYQLYSHTLYSIFASFLVMPYILHTYLHVFIFSFLRFWILFTILILIFIKIKTF